MKTNTETKNATKKNEHRLFILAGILLAVVSLISLTLVSIYHSRSNKTYHNAEQATGYLHRINEELLMVNRNVLMIISGAGSQDEVANSIDSSFSNIDFYMSQYSKIEGRSERELYRYQQAQTFTLAYEKKFNGVRNNLEDLNTELYIQEIHPLQTTASEMFSATIDINSENTQNQLNRLGVLFRVIQLIMLALLVIGEIAILLASKSTDKQSEALKRREAEVAEIQSKLNVSRNKVMDIAVTNILTGLKNRYALMEDLGKRITKVPLNIAIFNMDNFHLVNETYGYEFGDVYLTLLAEALKNEFSQYGEIYNYTSNGFCIVFNDTESENTAQRIAQKAIALCNQTYNVSNLAIQETATGCFTHTDPSESKNVNSLLVKMEGVMRQAKQQGGNRLAKL